MKPGDQPVQLIPKEYIRSDADITALIAENGALLACVYRTDFRCPISAQSVVGKLVTDVFSPLPVPAQRLLEKALSGESNWAALTLPIAMPKRVVERRFVATFLPWQSIDGEAVALIRMRLIEAELKDVYNAINRDTGRLEERLDHLLSVETSLDNLYIDALLDLTMRETGFDLAIQLDENGVILDIFDLIRSKVADVHPVGSNYLEFMDHFDSKFRERWNWVLEHSSYFNSFEVLPTRDGMMSRIVSRIRVTGVRTTGGLRVLQSFIKHIETFPPE